MLAENGRKIKKTLSLDKELCKKIEEKFKSYGAKSLSQSLDALMFYVSTATEKKVKAMILAHENFIKENQYKEEEECPR